MSHASRHRYQDGQDQGDQGLRRKQLSLRRLFGDFFHLLEPRASIKPRWPKQPGTCPVRNPPDG